MTSAGTTTKTSEDREGGDIRTLLDGKLAGVGQHVGRGAGAILLGRSRLYVRLAFPSRHPAAAGRRDADTGRVLPPPENFLLMLLCLSRIDPLRLTDNYRQVGE
jgi:hypothetical protein